MPHLTVHVLEEQLAGRESDLIAALTDAVVEVYGDWARDIAVVHLVGVPAGRWGVGGRPTDSFAPAITFGVREIALTRPDGNPCGHGPTAMSSQSSTLAPVTRTRPLINGPL